MTILLKDYLRTKAVFLAFVLDSLGPNRELREAMYAFRDARARNLLQELTW